MLDIKELTYIVRPQFKRKKIKPKRRDEFLIFALLWIFIGVYIINDPVFVSAKHKFLIDLRPYEWVYGSVIISYGFYVLHTWYKRK